MVGKVKYKYLSVTDVEFLKKVLFFLLIYHYQQILAHCHTSFSSSFIFHPSSLHNAISGLFLSRETPYCAIPITPQAGLAPAFPVILLCSCPPLPKSSVPLCTTIVLPSTLSGPMSLTRLSVMLPWEWPWSSVLKLPRSPTWRSVSEGAPCCLLKGLTGRRRGLEDVV